MKIVLGILAWNEESSIAATIGSLESQSLLKLADDRNFLVEIIVVPNGCSDRTPEVAEAALKKLTAAFPLVKGRVEPLREGGKSNAWNELIHRLSPADSDYFLLLDADIELLTAETLERMWLALEKTPPASISTDLPVKHLAKKKNPGLLDRLLLGTGSMTQAAPGQLTGQLYCARAAFLRRVWIPRGLIVDDGFIKQILCTEGYSQPVDNSRIVRAEGASHLFECYTKFRDIWNHQIRQATGHTLYTYFTSYVKREIPERPVFDALLKLSRDDPEWFVREIQSTIRRRGWWVMDTPSLMMRWRRVRFAKGAAKLKFFAIAAAATPYDLAVFFASNARLKSGLGKGLWKDTRTTTLT